MTESVKDYMLRRRYEARVAGFQKRYRDIENTPEAQALQDASTRVFKKALIHWRKGCHLKKREEPCGLAMMVEPELFKNKGVECHDGME